MRNISILVYQIGYLLYRTARRIAFPLLIYGRSCQVEGALPGVVNLFDTHGIPYWLGGGIAYDAIRGHRTRPHKDIDISILAEDKPCVIEMLEEAGYEVRQTRPTSFEARRRGLKIDLFAWQLNGDYREMLYNSEIAAAPAELFEAYHIRRFGNVDVRITPPELFHLFMPLIRNPKDRAFVSSCPLAPQYEMVDDRDEFSIVLPTKRIERAPHRAAQPAGQDAAHAEQDACLPR